MLDRIDLEILRILKENARTRASAISAKVNLSVSAVIERIRRLEEAHTVRAFTIAVDQKQL
ncbi:MAG: Lrp/AsnC family transcriptional regulator, partial [Eubacteriales bacterium]